MKPKEYFDSVKEDLQVELTRSAMGYLKSGLDLFHKEKIRSYSCIEPAIGNLSVAIELMLKTFLVKSNPLLVFKEPSLELRTLFTCPDRIPSEDFNWHYYDLIIRSYKNKTVGLNELISYYYVFFPKHKQLVKPYFDFISGCRNASVHFSLPSFQKYDLERTAYLTLNIFIVLKESEAFERFSYSLNDKDKKFLATYDAERNMRVSDKIKKARERSSTLAPQGVFIALEHDWEAFTTRCPICHSEGILTGYTELSVDQEGQGEGYPYLVFLADTFKCEECGLYLDDSEELQSAGMEIAYDRPEKDMDMWLGDFREQDYDDI